MINLFKSKTKINGEKEWRRKLKKLQKDLNKKVLLPAVKKGAAPILRDVKRKAPVKSGTLKKSIAAKGYFTKTGISVIIYLKKMKKIFSTTKKSKPATYGRILEFTNRQFMIDTVAKGWNRFKNGAFIKEFETRLEKVLK